MRETITLMLGSCYPRLAPAEPIWRFVGYIIKQPSWCELPKDRPLARNYVRHLRPKGGPSPGASKELHLCCITRELAFTACEWAWTWTLSWWDQGLRKRPVNTFIMDWDLKGVCDLSHFQTPTQGTQHRTFVWFEAVNHICRTCFSATEN